MEIERMVMELENFVSPNWRNSYRDAASDLAKYSGLDDAESAEIIALGERWDVEEQSAVDRLKGATK